eukprot:2119531-Pyramimonas_sp.AAC.1
MPLVCLFTHGLLSAVQVGCAMIGRGELGFMMANEALESGLVGDVAFSATVRGTHPPARCVKLRAQKLRAVTFLLRAVT